MTVENPYQDHNEAIKRLKEAANGRYSIEDSEFITYQTLIDYGFEGNPDHDFPDFNEFRHSIVKEFTIGNFNNEYWLIDGINQWLTIDGPQIIYIEHLKQVFFWTTGRILTKSK